MKKFLSLIAIVMLAAGAAWADEAVFDFNANALTMFPGITEASTSSTSGGDFTENKSTTVNGVTLTVTPSGANTANRIWNDYNLGLQLRVYGGQLIITAPEGQSVKNVAFNTSMWNDPDADSGIISENAWVGSASTLTLNITGQIRISSMTVTFGEGGTVTPDPTITQIDSLQQIADLDDNTQFQFMKDVYVNYTSGKYLYLQQHNADADCYTALLYDEIAENYQLGDVIPAGWKGTKKTYHTLVEVTNVSDMGEALGTIDEYWTEPFAFSGYMSYIDEEWVNYKVEFQNLTISEINGKNFTISETTEGDDGEPVTTTIAGYNQFGIELPEEGDGYDMTFMVGMYNGNIQLYPIEIAGTGATPLWKVWYMGEDGEQYTIADELYVDYIDEPNKLVYVTDNATSVLFDLYADWGYTWEEEWEPDWIAIDCADNEQLYNTVKEMNIIKAGTLSGTLQDSYTNPRFVITEVPEEADGIYPEIVYPEIELTDSLFLDGRKMVKITAIYNDGKLEGTVAESGVKQAIELIKEPSIEGFMFENGKKYTVKAFIILKDAWEWEDEAPKAAPAKNKSLKAIAKTPARKQRRKIMADDPAWYTNMEIHAIELINFEPSAVTDLNASKKVSNVKYVNALGQVSNNPFQGVNIVVTTFTDGSQQTAKVVR